MTAIIGYFHRDFQANHPRKLCRRRERWIESPPVEGPLSSLFRLVISAAERSTEDRGRTKHGLEASSISCSELLWKIFSTQTIVAWAEESPAFQTPSDASGVEFFEMSRPGVPLRTWFSRWEMQCAAVEDIENSFQSGADVFVINPVQRPENDPITPQMPLPEVLDGGGGVYRNPQLSEKLRDALFLLTGQREGGDSMERYLPVAINDVLEEAEAVILLHADKDSDCIGIYCKSDPKYLVPRIQDFSEETGIPAVLFEVPPMVARWDRVWKKFQEENETVVAEEASTDEESNDEAPQDTDESSPLVEPSDESQEATESQVSTDEESNDEAPQDTDESHPDLDLEHSEAPVKESDSAELVSEEEPADNPDESTK